MILLLDNETESLPKFISAQKLLEDKFILEFSNNNDDNKNKITKVKKRRTELTIGGDIACFVKPHSDFVCDTIVRGILPNWHNGLESPHSICINYWQQIWFLQYNRNSW